MTGLETILKFSPLVGACVFALIGFGELKSDIKNIYTLQQQQYEAIQKQLDNIENRLNNGK